jgi:flagellar biosynthetic protein FlhF
MKMQRYHARDMRQALARIRAEQGPDAVILSTQRTTDGVIVCAAVDYDFSEAPAGPAVAADPAAVQALPRLVEDVVALQQVSRAPRAAPAHVEPELRLGDADDDEEHVSHDAVRAEIRSLRKLLESQVAALAWNDFTRRQPLKARVLEELTNVGLARELSLQIVGELPDALDAEQASRLPLAHLTRRVPTAAGGVLERGGVLALVGPNGVGKTTTLAKFATRWVLERGPREIALVSTDRDRFGSQEQLQALGRVLGVPALIAEGPAELASTLERLRDRRLVLIDTPGINPRSDRLDLELGALGELRPDLEIALVMAASAQAGALEETALRFGTLRPAHCVLTKVDEATSLGGALSTLVQSGLPVSWLCVGPRVPEDIEAARAHHVVARAVKLARKSGANADEDLLARRFGGLLNAAA